MIKQAEQFELEAHLATLRADIARSREMVMELFERETNRFEAERSRGNCENEETRKELSNIAVFHQEAIHALNQAAETLRQISTLG